MVQNKVEAAYARSDLFERRRRLMDDWSEYLDGRLTSNIGYGTSALGGLRCAPIDWPRSFKG